MSVEPRAAEVHNPPTAPLIDRLAQRAVYDTAFAKPVLYTWTTDEQVTQLRTSQVLLVADATTGTRITLFNRALMALQDSHAPGHRVAQLLLQRDELRKRRYAWTSPFATVLGLGPRSYGNSLIEVELHPDAIVARFEPANVAQPFSFVDLRGRPLAQDEVLRMPERIAAVYHVRTGSKDQVPFREYVLCNESMLFRWALTTPEIRARLAEEIEMLETLQRGPFAQLPDEAAAEPAQAEWKVANAPVTLLSLWHASLAFANERYRPTPANLGRIADALRQYHGEGPPLVVRPRVVRIQGNEDAQASQ